jgi:hypothetical protein
MRPINTTASQLYFYIQNLELSEVVRICQLTKSLEDNVLLGYLARIGSFAPTTTDDWLSIVNLCQKEIQRVGYVFSSLDTTVELKDFVDIASDGHAVTGLRYNRGNYQIVITHKWDSISVRSWAVEFYCNDVTSQFENFRFDVADAIASQRAITRKISHLLAA